MNVINRPVSELIPYERNTKQHDKTQIANVAESIKQFGFVQPVVVDKDGVIVIGHCRVLAAKKLGMKEVPCVCVDDLTPEQVNALRIVDNKSAESPWDFNILSEELPDLDMSAFEFDWWFPEEENEDEEYIDYEETKRQFQERMAACELSEDDEEYQEFLQKFEAKKTTDDCYTPENVYEVIKNWAVEKYGLHGRTIVRPFYPGGDFENEKYPNGCVVIDNPPFSILAKIKKFYTSNGIDFFMFCQSLTMLSGNDDGVNYVCADAQITYENGAQISTGFVTNLGDYKIISAPDLYKAVKEENDKNLAKIRRHFDKYKYPDHVLTASMLNYYAKYGIVFELKVDDIHFIRELESQREQGKSIYGSGFLLSDAMAAEKAAAEKAAAIEWTLSEKELEIIKNLGK